MRWVRHVAARKTKKCVYNFSLKKLKGRACLEHFSVDGEIILNLILCGLRECGLNPAASGHGRASEFVRTVMSGLHKSGNISDQLNIQYILKTDYVDL
jgi:hypothetical protein